MVGKLLRLGIFAAITLGLTMWMAAQIAKVNFDDRYDLTATFEDVTGLFSGDDVKLAGVIVGKVTSIDVVDGQAVLGFEVDSDVRVPTDSAVAIRWRNLIGQRYVSIEPGDAGQLLDDGDTVARTRSVVDLGQLVNRLGPLAQAIDPDRLNQIFLALVEAFDGNQDAFDSLVADLDLVLATLVERQDTISQLVTDYETITGALARRDQQIQTMVDNLLEIAQAFAANRDLVDRALVEFAGFTTNLDAVLTQNASELGHILENLAVITGTARGRLAELEQALVNLPPALTDLFDTVDEGEAVVVNVICLSLAPAPCPTPMILSGGG